MIKVNVILNDISWKKYIKNPNSFIDKKVELLNKKNKLYKKNTLICSLLLSGAKEIKKLNKKFRKKNKSTDVLSFPSYEKKKLDKIIKKEKEIYLGDIIINYSKLKKNSKKKQFIKHLDKLWVHALLHLFGHKHRKNLDFKRMSILEKKFLNKLA